jgi:hypothetical protein
MALELPAQVDVDLQRSRLSTVKLNKREELALASVEDKELRGLLAQIVRSMGGSQQNFERVAQQFPLSPAEGGVVLGPESVGATQLKAGIRQYGIVTALPSSPSKGDRCVFDTGTTGVYWELVYTGEETYPWAKVGGPPLLKQQFGSTRTIENQTTYEPLPTDPLSIELPLGGDYHVALTADIEPQGGEGSYGALSYDGEGFPLEGFLDFWAIRRELSGATQAFNTVGRPGALHGGCPKGTVVEEKAKTGGEYKVAFRKRFLVVDPMRVG